MKNSDRYGKMYHCTHNTTILAINIPLYLERNSFKPFLFLILLGNTLRLNQGGITEAINQSVKFDVPGLGHNVLNDFQLRGHTLFSRATSF